MNKNIKKYIDKHIDELMSVENLVIYLINEGMDFESAKTLAGEYRGLINTYAKNWLKAKIGSGARNSLTFLQLLKQLEETTSDGFEDKVIINFDLVNDSENKIINIPNKVIKVRKNTDG